MHKYIHDYVRIHDTRCRLRIVYRIQNLIAAAIGLLFSSYAEHALLRDSHFHTSSNNKP